MPSAPGAGGFAFGCKFDNLLPFDVSLHSLGRGSVLDDAAAASASAAPPPAPVATPVAAATSTRVLLSCVVVRRIIIFPFCL